METKNLKLQEDVNDIIAKEQLFGWKVKSKEKVREMTGLNQYENFTKIVLERDENDEKYSKYVKLEEEYKTLERELASAVAEKLLWADKKPAEKTKPVWKKTKSNTSGGYTVEWDEYYGGYKPLPWIVYVGCFSPFLPILLIIIIVNGSKKKKLQKQLAVELAEWNAKYDEWYAALKVIDNTISEKQDALEEIIAELNS